MDRRKNIEGSVAALQRELATLLHSARIDKSMTQATLARNAGVSRPTVIAAEAGNGVSSQNLLAIMDCLGLSFARKAMEVAPSRPRLKDVMAAERARQHSILQMSFQRAIDSASALHHPLRAPTHAAGDVVAAHPASRPRLKDVMAAERARQSGFHSEMTP